MRVELTLGTEIAIALAFKAAALAILYLAFFAPARHPVVTAGEAAAVIFGPALPAR